jgi:large subunit ribosomal protein L23
MSQEKLMTVLLGPHVSEKGTTLAEKNNQVVFRVRTDANKADIRKAVELMFEVKVEGVQVVNVHGKNKRFGRRKGKRSNWKKAYVRLAEGQNIDFLGAE